MDKIYEQQIIFRQSAVTGELPESGLLCKAVPVYREQHNFQLDGGDGIGPAIRGSIIVFPGFGHCIYDFGV